MKDTAHPHVDRHHSDRAHPHVQSVPPDPGLRKAVVFGAIAGVVVIGGVVALISSSVHEVAVKNVGDIDVRVEYAWTANGQRVTRDRQVAPGNSISFGFAPQSELVVYHPAPDANSVWAVIPVGEREGRFEVAPKSRTTLTATKDGQPLALTLTPLPGVSR